MTRTWDCVCESEYERDAWVLGIENLAREARGMRGGVIGAAAAARARDGGDARGGTGAAVTVARAIGKFKRGGRVNESSVGRRDEAPSKRVMEGIRANQRGVSMGLVGGRDGGRGGEHVRWRFRRRERAVATRG